MILASIFGLLLGVVTLDGVTGDQLSASASFDANNVRVGDPLILTVDFVGSADFTALHPPALAREVDASVWKVDDVSARTETWEGYGRRLVYRVRVLKAGVHRFPALTFSYTGRGGTPVAVSTLEIPVHVKPCAQVALAGVYEGATDLPMPDGLVIGTPAGLGEDALFDWKKACGNPTADAFAKFDVPEARLNEAACAVVEGNWARAIKLYSALEWRIGQTPAIERGLVAALARKTGDAAAELPVWRQVLRPVLRYSWLGRVLVTLGVLGALALLFWLSGRVIRALAVVLVVLTFAPLTASAENPFEMMERLQQQMFEQMENFNSITLGGGTPTRQRQPEVKVKASLRTDRTGICQGEKFNFILALETPKTSSIEQVNVRPSEMFGLVLLANKFENLPDGASSNPSNVVKRMQLPVRYDVPFHAPVSFTVSGMVNTRTVTNGGRSSFSFSQSFRVETAPVDVEIKPLPTENQPADFSGAIGDGFELTRSMSSNRVETNDVITVINTLTFNGFLPPDAVTDLVERRPGRVRWREYFVADGAAAIPERRLTYYDSVARAYKTAVAPALGITYRPAEALAATTVAVDAATEEGASDALKLRFYPRDAAPVVAVSTGPHTVTEERGMWARIDDGRHAGWVRKEDLK